jgi:hypothetical protein
MLNLVDVQARCCAGRPIHGSNHPRPAQPTRLGDRRRLWDVPLKVHHQHVRSILRRPFTASTLRQDVIACILAD